MVFAAGLGTRLGDIGRDTPKALLEVGGATMLEHVCRRLVLAGVDRIVVNVHHHAERIQRFVREHTLGADILVSRETEFPLETGGGLLHARNLFRRDGSLVLHNVDVLCDFDLRAMHTAALDSGALAILAVNQRKTSRHLLFDDLGLFGRSDSRDGTRITVREPVGAVRPYAFAGIHVVAPDFLDLITERGVFSILEPYLRLAGEGHRILPFPLGTARWLEVGSVERLEQARREFAGPPG